MTANRKQIFTGDTVKLISSSAATAEFEIGEVIGGSADCLCCAAVHTGTRKSGRLREFYPVDSDGAPVYSAERPSNGELIFTDTAKREGIEKAKERFAKKYLDLKASVSGSKRGGKLRVPDYEVFYSCDERTGGMLEGGTVYVWSEDLDCETLDKCFERLREGAASYPEKSLYDMLSVFADVADAVRELHERGIISPDITAYNFGVAPDGGIYFFDADGDSDVTAFTRIAAPEAEFGEADFRSDIYSLGCLLYGALFPGKPYRWPHWARIPAFVNASPLITATEATSNVYLRRGLITILQKCVELVPSLRYSSCAELAAAVRQLLNERFYPDEFDSVPANRASEVFTRHLIVHPLYENAPGRTGKLNVLLVGFGTYAQKFADIALAAGQMDGVELNVLACSEDPARDRELYLETRPAFTEFFRVDGSEVVDPYGSIAFRELVIDPSKGDGAKRTKAALRSVFKEFAPTYVFIALGDDALNRSAAAMCAEAAKHEGTVCSLNVVRTKRDRAKAVGNAVRVNEAPDKDSPFEKNLDRMLTNCAHLRSLADNGAGDLSEAVTADLLSFKYKLHMLGIDVNDAEPTSAGYNAAAAKYYDAINASGGAGADILVHSEHRGRVVRLVCAGWRQSVDLERCALKGIANAHGKFHAALVRSRPGRGLVGAFANRQYWNTAEQSAIDALDDLDRLSVIMHRHYKAAADALRSDSETGGILSGAAVNFIRSACLAAPAAEKAFNDWYSCLRLVWDDSYTAATAYYANERALLQAARTLPDAASVTEEIGRLTAALCPVINSALYEDLKERDAFYIKRLPFILTYRSDITLAVPMVEGDVFTNIRSAAVIDPRTLVYLCYVDRQRDIDTLVSHIGHICEFLDGKKLRASVRLLIAYGQGLTDCVKPLLVSLSGGFGGRIVKVSVAEALSDADVPDTVSRLLSRAGADVDLIEKNGTRLSWLLTGAGFYSGYPNFRFDPVNDRLTDAVGCDFLRYIDRAGSRLMVADVVSVNGSEPAGNSDPELQYDYKSLWTFFSNDANARFWKRTCEHLEKYANEHDAFVSFKLDQKTDTLQPVTQDYILENIYYEGLSKVLKDLKDIGSIITYYNITSYSSDSIAVTVGTWNRHINPMRQMFQNIDKFARADMVSVARLNSEVDVKYASLEVRDLTLNSQDNFSMGINQVLSFLYDRRLVMPITGNAVSSKSGSDAGTKYIYNFKYATRQVRDLMISSGKILEVYVYHKCLESGRFDDISSGQIIRWDGDGIENEFDCILTKGLRTLFVECKATYTIRQEYYYKLAALTSRFGVNARAVLIADTRESSEDSTNGQTIAMQIKRGNKLGVYTITDKNDIDNIDAVLERLIDGEN